MDHITGHQLVKDCYEHLQNHIDCTNLYKVSMELKCGYDESNGHFFGFEFDGLYKSVIDNHIGEQDKHLLMYYPEEGLVAMIYDNNGAETRIESLGEFRSMLYVANPNTPEEVPEPFSMIPEEPIIRVIQLTKSEIDLLESLIDKTLSGDEHINVEDSFEEVRLEQLSCKLDGSIALK